MALTRIGARENTLSGTWERGKTLGKDARALPRANESGKGLRFIPVGCFSGTNLASHHIFPGTDPLGATGLAAPGATGEPRVDSPAGSPLEAVMPAKHIWRDWKGKEDALVAGSDWAARYCAIAGVCIWGK